jgi:hypothetical protein
MSAIPAAAQVPAATMTAYDGTYLGVSHTFEENSGSANPGRTWTHYCLQYPPGTLSIVDGIAKAGTLEGSVDPQGVLIMRRPNGSRFDGRINSQGTVTGRETSGCNYQWVWQKAPPPTMPFDGDYIGVSRESRSSKAKCAPSDVPGTLIIRNSVALGTWQGTVSPQGILSLRSPNGTPVGGQIDSQGIIRGQDTSDIGCSSIWVWRRKG